jgi:hypothetical protein
MTNVGTLPVGENNEEITLALDELGRGRAADDRCCAAG